MKCLRCGKDIEADAPQGVVICGSCADDLRQEEEAQRMAIQAEVEASAEEVDFQMNKEAYEEAEREHQLEIDRCR